MRETNIFPDDMTLDDWYGTRAKIMQEGRDLDAFVKASICYAFRVGGPLVPYELDELEEIASSLNMSVNDFTTASLINLSNTIDYYLRMKEEKGLQKNKERIKILKKASKGIDKFIDALAELDEFDDRLLRGVSEFAQDDHSADLRDITKDLRTVQYHLDAFDSALRPRGRGKDVVSPNLILMLANIYRDITGKWPKRKHNPVSGNDYGDFRNFVIATVSPIDPKRASHGVDDLIREVLKNTEPSSMLGFMKIFGPGIIFVAFRLMGINMEKIQVINPISKSPSD